MAGQYGTTVEFSSTVTEIRAGENTSFEALANIGEHPDDDINTVQTYAYLYVGGTSESNIVSRQKAQVDENSTVNYTLSHTFKDPNSRQIEKPVFIRIETKYLDTALIPDDPDESVDTDTIQVTVLGTPGGEDEGEDEGADVIQIGESQAEGTYKDAYRSNHSTFEIAQISYEDDATETPNPIELEYTAPSVSVDTAGRFATHSIIGGSTVRQKIGEDPIEVTVDGVVKESTARQMDNLRDAEFGTIYSNRLPGGSLQVHFASTSTAPLEDSGAVAITDDEFLYTFTLSCVEVFV